MLTQIKSEIWLIIGIIGLILAVGIGVYINSLKSTINLQQKQYLRQQMKVANLQLEVERYSNIITLQNDRIKQLKIQEQLHRKELNRWKSLPPEVKYKVIYRTKYKIKKVKSNECKDIKTIINGVRNINYNEL